MHLTHQNALVNVPVLGYTHFSKEFILDIYASLKGLGAILSQQDGDGKP